MQNAGPRPPGFFLRDSEVLRIGVRTFRMRPPPPVLINLPHAFNCGKFSEVNRTCLESAALFSVATRCFVVFRAQGSGSGWGDPVPPGRRLRPIRIRPCIDQFITCYAGIHGLMPCPQAQPHWDIKPSVLISTEHCVCLEWSPRMLSADRGVAMCLFALLLEAMATRNWS